MIVHEDRQSDVAPLARSGRDDDTVRPLCTVEADLGQIPEDQITQRRGEDGFMYFYLDGKIEGVCKSMVLSIDFEMS